MGVQTVNLWAQLIASLGVIGSLFYLAAQVRQDTRVYQYAEGKRGGEPCAGEERARSFR